MKHCEYCSGTSWILDQRELGPCVCQPAVFEEACTLLEGHFDTDQEGSMFLNALRDVLDDRKSAQEDRRRLMAAGGYNADDDVTPAVLDSFTDERDALEDIRAAMASYLVVQGISTPPMTQLKDDRLQAVCDAVWH